jgi:methylated-DNA-[protein]-cysteine S-methyltransferase
LDEVQHFDAVQRVVFRTRFGWVALVGNNQIVERLSFGHATRQAASHALPADESGRRENSAASMAGELVERLRSYFAGEFETFDDFRIDTSEMTPFQRKVVRLCQEIPYGQTRTYGQLAARAGAPGAARAVGNVMRSNRVPIIVPCHRVVASGGSLGGFSAPDGIAMKKRLLDMEAKRVVGLIEPKSPVSR